MKKERKKCAYIGETRRRSWLKSLIWRITGILILGGLSWLITHDLEQTSWITITFHSIRLVLYYFHERAWENVEWGRIKVQERVELGEGI
ncbi:MAG: DUF2061 domain-containing protein [Dehalococcoidales bacterium]|jgi:uncharacterized membrane protein|nr:DUF2061 domain-containing protein [Dehalococcoidales bacterium]MDP6738201.1 DUF2061 domain-containing protein [Dehalococcoidales bacterium]|tara:strand:+ start:1728 stop:1997 length:270 start_codon:yes stop_codon:yes gene_type:complete